MVSGYLTGLIGILAVMLGWVGVQIAWRRVFPGGQDPDALAGRLGCHGCKEQCESTTACNHGSPEEKS